MRYDIRSTKQFDKWLDGLKDFSAKTKVLARLARVENGNFGDCKPIGPSLYEMRFFFGSGLRIYYTIQDQTVILLLIGGDKSTQVKDIKKAEKLLREMEQES